MTCRKDGVLGGGCAALSPPSGYTSSIVHITYASQTVWWMDLLKIVAPIIGGMLAGGWIAWYSANRAARTARENAEAQARTARENLEAQAAISRQEERRHAAYSLISDVVMIDQITKDIHRLTTAIVFRPEEQARRETIELQDMAELRATCKSAIGHALVMSERFVRGAGVINDVEALTEVVLRRNVQRHEVEEQIESLLEQCKSLVPSEPGAPVTRAEDIRFVEPPPPA